MSEPYYGWAVDAVEGLRWLVDLDDCAFSGTRENLRGRSPEVIDVVHVRWATSTAVTALDLCGVELAIRSGARDFWTSHAPVLDQVVPSVEKAEGKLPEWAREWLETVLNDPEYKALKGMRDPLTHRFLVRSALLRTAAPTGHQSRTEFDVPVSEWIGGRLTAREILVLARDVADRYVNAFGSAFGSDRNP
jgi:hypothetical protein